MAGEVARPFDLENGLPVRAVLLRSGADESVLCLCFHHMVFDGWSTGLLFDELAGALRRVRGGRPSPLPPVEAAVRRRDRVPGVAPAGPAVRRAARLLARRSWTGVDAFELTPDLPRPARRTAPGADRTFTVPEHVAAALERIASEHGATLFMTLLAAWQTLLYRYSGIQDITVGTTAAERDLVESEPLIGLFVNMLVLRGEVSGDLTFAELLERTRDRAVEAYAHQDVPFDRLRGGAVAGARPVAHPALPDHDQAEQRAAAGAGAARPGGGRAARRRRSRPSTTSSSGSCGERRAACAAT